MPHAVLAGQTGSGKNNLEQIRLLDAVQSRGCSVVAAFPKEKDGLRFVAELYALYGDAVFDFLVVERIGDADRVVMKRMIPSSDHPDFWTRLQENELLGGNALEKVVMQRGLTLAELPEHPVLHRYGLLVINVRQDLAAAGQWMPDSEVGRLLIPGGPWWMFAVRNLRDPDLRYELEGLVHLTPRQQQDMLWPVTRMFDALFRCPPIRARTSRPASWDRRAFHKAGGVNVILGGGASANAIRTFIGADLQEAMALYRSGMDLPLIYAMDEVNNFALCGDECSRYLSTMRDYGVSIELVIQSFDFPTLEIRSNVLQNCDLYLFRQGDPESAEMAAKALRGAYDRMKVHHHDTTTRQHHDGYEDIDQVQRSQSWDGYGVETGTTARRVTNQRARYREVSDARAVYEGGTDQQFWQSAEMQKLPTGSCWVKRAGECPYRFDAPLLEDSWVFPNVWKAKAEECARLIKQLPIFEAPRLVVPPTSAPPTPPAPRPTPRSGPSAPKGMRKRGRS